METRLIDVEYEPSTRAGRIARKNGQIYVGIGLRASDGITVLKIRAPGSTKNHNIEVGQLYAVTVNGRRHVLETPWERWRLREQELRALLDGGFNESWAAEYFDPASPKYFKRTYGNVMAPPQQSIQPPRRDKFYENLGVAALLALIIIWFLV